MSVLAAHLRKDFRAHRTAMIALLVIVTICIVAAPLLLSRYWLVRRGFVDWFTFGSVVVAIVGLAPDLVHSERRENGFRFLGRLTNGVSYAFWSKCCVLVVGTVGLGLLTYLLTSLIAYSNGAGDAHPSDQVLTVDGLSILVSVLSAGVLVLGVATWLPRAHISWIVTIGLLAFVALPGFLLLRGTPYPWDALPWTAILVAAPLVSSLTAWGSFVLGRRFGRGSWSAVWRGSIVLLIAQVGLTVLLGVWHHDWHHFDLRKDVAIQGGYLGLDQQKIYLNVAEGKDRPLLGTIVDLGDGSYRSIEGADKYFVLPPPFGIHSFWKSRTNPLVAHTGDFDEVTYFDTRDASELIHKGTATSQTQLNGFLELHKDAARSMSPMRTADGLRLWLHDRHLFMHKANGVTEELPWDTKDTAWRLCGFGVPILGKANQWHVYDFARRRKYPVGFEEVTMERLWVLPHAWLVGSGPQLEPNSGREGLMRLRATCDWNLVDPDSSDLGTPAPGLEDGDSVQAVLDDGEVLAYRPCDESPFCYQVNTQTGTRVPLSIRGLEEGYVIETLSEAGNSAPLRGPSDERLLRIAVRANGESVIGFAMLKPGARSISPLIEALSFIGWQDDGHLILIKDNKVIRADSDTGQSTVVWPLQEEDR